jgi:hypothetical protein
MASQHTANVPSVHARLGSIPRLSAKFIGKKAKGELGSFGKQPIDGAGRSALSCQRFVGAADWKHMDATILSNSSAAARLSVWYSIASATGAPTQRQYFPSLV